MSRHLPSALCLSLCDATSSAALAASDEIGRGDVSRADRVAVDAMRSCLNGLAIDGIVAIGEGERDEAPMLYIGERVGRGGVEIDLALDPLEGTTLTSQGRPGAMSVLAATPRGGALRAPDVYMEKIVMPRPPRGGSVDLDLSPRENVSAAADALGVSTSSLSVCVLDRPRHAELIDAARSVSCRVRLIGDGDVSAAISAATSCDRVGGSVEIYMGAGGAPEGVLAAAALSCLGGWMQGRLLCDDDEKRERARRMGMSDPDAKLSLKDMISDDAIFVASGVTGGDLVDGVVRSSAGMIVDSLVLHASTGWRRRIRAERLVADGRPAGS